MQVSYGQANLSEIVRNDGYGNAYISFFEDLYKSSISSITVDQNGYVVYITYSNGVVANLLNEVIVTTPKKSSYTLESYDQSDMYNSTDSSDYCPSKDWCDCYGFGCYYFGGGGGGSGSETPPSNMKTWYLDYDGDGYHSETYDAVNRPGDKWKTTTSGVDCDDTRPQYTTVCCTKTCNSGYELNVDTCECKLLPPCFGTVKDFETSNSFNTNTILNNLNSTLGDFGISTDVMDIIKQMNVFDPKTIAASTDIATHANAIGGIGDVSQVIMSYSDYIDEPSTQNLLKLALDSASPFLSPAASLAISTIDLYKDSNGDSKLDLLLKAAGDYIDRQRDCNLGLGVRNAIF